MFRAILKRFEDLIPNEDKEENNDEDDEGGEVEYAEEMTDGGGEFESTEVETGDADKRFAETEGSGSEERLSLALSKMEEL